MAEQSEAKREWREATPDDSDEGSSSDGSDSSGSDGSMSYKSQELTSRLVKKVRGEEEDDPDFDPAEEAKACGKQPRLTTLDEDTGTPRLEVLAHQ
jgi:hypothetical protein